MSTHDDGFDSYCASCTRVVNQVHATAVENVGAYTQALMQALSKP